MKILLLLLVLSIVGCAAPPSVPDPAGGKRPVDEAARLVAQLNNSDITWDGNFFGLAPQISGAVAKRLVEIGPAADEALIGALADPQRFAAAHVMLTTIHTEEVTLSGGEWN